MGLGSRESSNLTYLSIYGGEIVQEWRKEEPKADWIPAGKELKVREITKGKNAGRKVWYVGFDYVEGLLRDVKLDTSGDYGAQLELKIQDVDDTYLLKINVDSAAANSFLMKMKNLDVSKEISFQPWSMDPDAWFKLTSKTSKGYKSGMTIKQGDEKVENYYTKDEPKGMPELVIKQVRGEQKIDSTDRDIFLDERLKEFIKDLEAHNKSANAPANGRYTEAPAPAASNDEEYDDLPF